MAFFRKKPFKKIVLNNNNLGHELDEGDMWIKQLILSNSIDEGKLEKNKIISDKNLKDGLTQEVIKNIDKNVIKLKNEYVSKKISADNVEKSGNSESNLIDKKNDEPKIFDKNNKICDFDDKYDNINFFTIDLDNSIESNKILKNHDVMNDSLSYQINDIQNEIDNKENDSNFFFETVMNEVENNHSSTKLIDNKINVENNNLSTKLIENKINIENNNDSQTDFSYYKLAKNPEDLEKISLYDLIDFLNNIQPQFLNVIQKEIIIQIVDKKINMIRELIIIKKDRMVLLASLNVINALTEGLVSFKLKIIK
ncbi:MAG: hypothetical protein ACRDCG_02350 [Mycoplasmoidaceae bacterium]